MRATVSGEVMKLEVREQGEGDQKRVFHNLHVYDGNDVVRVGLPDRLVDSASLLGRGESVSLVCLVNARSGRTGAFLSVNAVEIG